MNVGVSNEHAFRITGVIPIMPMKFMPKSIQIKFLRHMVVWKVHTWQKTKYH